MPREQIRPDSLGALIAMDENECGVPDPGLWEHVNEHAYAFHALGEVTLERIGENGEYRLKTDASVLPGLLLTQEEDSIGETVARSRGQRIEDRALRLTGQLERRRPADALDGHRPRRLPVAYLPKAIPVGHALFGASARGGKVRLSTSVTRRTDGLAHSTVFDGESRDGLRPTHYPYTAVCKLELWTRPAPSGAWMNSGRHASGFLVGRRTLLTSGHAFADARLVSGTAAIKVIPACWGESAGVRPRVGDLGTPPDPLALGLRQRPPAVQACRPHRRWDGFFRRPGVRLGLGGRRRLDDGGLPLRHQQVGVDSPARDQRAG